MKKYCNHEKTYSTDRGQVDVIVNYSFKSLQRNPSSSRFIYSWWALCNDSLHQRSLPPISKLLCAGIKSKADSVSMNLTPFDAFSVCFPCFYCEEASDVGPIDGRCVLSNVSSLLTFSLYIPKIFLSGIIASNSVT